MFKNFIVLLVLLVVSAFAEPEWTHSFEEAKKQAAAEKKGVVLMFSKESCDACWYMENIVFEDEAVKLLVMNNFIPVYLDVDSDVLPEGFKYIGTPTFYFTRANGEKLGHRINGASNVKDFTIKVNTIIEELNH